MFYVNKFYVIFISSRPLRRKEVVTTLEEGVQRLPRNLIIL